MTQDLQTGRKEWYLKGEAGSKDGPYSIVDLKCNPRLTPDTLVWKEGFREWVPIRQVWELRHLFAEPDTEEEVEEEEGEKDFPTHLSPDGLVIDLRSDHPPPYIWIALLVVAIIYITLKLYL